MTLFLNFKCTSFRQDVCKLGIVHCRQDIVCDLVENILPYTHYLLINGSFSCSDMAENQMLGGSSFPFPLQMFFKSVLHFIYLFIARQIDRFPVDM
jgi:hypothetical protein